MFIFVLKKIIAVILSAFMLVLSFSAAPEKHEAKNPNELKSTFTVLSDAHIEGLDVEFTFIDTYKVFAKILRDAKAMDSGNDAIVFLGDNTMNGQDIENMLFFGGLNNINPAEEIIVAPGNHDISNGEGSYSEYLSRFLGYNNIFFSDGLTTPYFCKIVDGNYFIILSTEETTVDYMYITDEQIEWLKGLLEQAEEDGAPIFVMCHYPVNYLQDRDTDELSEILNDYDNLLYFCGHTHFEYSEHSVYEYNGVNCINLPRSTEWKTEGYDTGIGAQVEVYEDEVLVRIRDFYDSIWLDEFSYPIEK